MRAVLTQEQEMLRTTAQRLAETLRVNTPSDIAKIDDAKAWRTLAEAGFLAMRARDESGAPSLSGFDAMLAVEALAGALAPTPFLGALLAGELLALAQAPAALTEAVGDGSARYGLLLTRGLDGLADAAALRDTVCFEARGAAHVLALRKAGGGAQVMRFALQDAAPLNGADLTRPLSAFTDLAAKGEAMGAPLGPGDLDRWTAFAISLACADIVGALRAGLRGVVEYAKTRIQYEVPIGSFQAVQHMCAEMLVQTEAAASVTHYAAWAVDALEPAESLLAARTAKAYCAPVAQRVGETLMQTYGGIGQTWEHVAHLRTRRALLGRGLFGDDAHHLPRIADARLGCA